MAEPLRARLARLRAERNARRRRDRKIRHRIRVLNAAIKRTLRALVKPKGAAAADFMLGYVGQTEHPTGSNDSAFLAAWRRRIPSLSWMKGQPWCGFAVRAAYQIGANKNIGDRVVYTPNIVNDANAGRGFKRVNPYKAKKGDLVVFDFDGGGADHVGLALGPASGGAIRTVEGNTSAGDSGSQSNGGGVFKRIRPLNVVAAVARPK